MLLVKLLYIDSESICLWKLSQLILERFDFFFSFWWIFLTLILRYWKLGKNKFTILTRDNSNLYIINEKYDKWS